MVTAGGISIHAIDVSRGIPARGLEMALYRIERGSRVLVCRGTSSASGTLDHRVARGEDVIVGLYEVEFAIGAYFRAEGIAVPDPAFLEDVTFRFGVAAPDQHYHLPLKFTPWGYSLFRGGA